MCVCSTRGVHVGDLLDGPAAVLLAGEWAGDQPAGVGSSTPQTSALPAHRVLHAHPLLGLRAACPTRLQPARLFPEVRTCTHTHTYLLAFFSPLWMFCLIFCDLFWTLQGFKGALSALHVAIFRSNSWHLKKRSSICLKPAWFVMEGKPTMSFPS